MAKKVCSGGSCQYIISGNWYEWGRWLMLGVLIAVLILLIPLCGYLMSRYRMRRGQPPIHGCAWMFPNPFKDANAIKTADFEQQQPAKPRYRPPNVYRQYQQHLQQYRADSLRQNSSSGEESSRYFPQESSESSRYFPQDTSESDTLEKIH